MASMMVFTVLIVIVIVYCTGIHGDLKTREVRSRHPSLIGRACASGEITIILGTCRASPYVALRTPSLPLQPGLLGVGDGLVNHRHLASICII